MKNKKKVDLAINGGKKVRKRDLPPRKAFGLNELESIVQLFKLYNKKGVDFGYQGYFEKRYTRDFVKYMGGIGYADVVCTGTAAIYVSLASLQLSPGTHVLVSPVTDPGTINAIILNQLVPVLVDAENNSFNIDPFDFKNRITEKTKAAIIVHVAGKAAKVDLICDIAKKERIIIIEDCSQAHGAKLKNKLVGNFGDIAVFSTMYRKNHATGGCGGVIYTKNKDLYNLARSYADRGKPFHSLNFNEKDPSTFLFPALNLNIDELSCAVGISTLKKLNTTIKKRISFLKKLEKSLLEKSRCCKLSKISNFDSPFFHPIEIDLTKISCSKEQFALSVVSEGININPNYKYVVCEWPWVKQYLFDDYYCTQAINYRMNSFNLLFNENYGDQEINDIIKAIVKVENYFLK
ncbi:MAG: DegT/DnrJ/EryC1/StrS family aminotransferase [Actinobacteria bacterium]|nr:DegT/DnrJ/EryC1/StrS family aminotransferase [Actinomycetota bacterium]